MQWSSCHIKSARINKHITIVFVSIQVCQFRKSHIVANAQSDFKLSYTECRQRIARWECFRLSKFYPSRHVDVEEMYLHACNAFSHVKLNTYFSKFAQHLSSIVEDSARIVDAVIVSIAFGNWSCDNV